MSAKDSVGQRVYFDHNATSPLRTRVRKAMIDVMDVSGNPSSIHTEGRKARAIIEYSREKIAALVGAGQHDIMFTSGGTEANNTALSPGLVAEQTERREGALCFVSGIEHPSVHRGGRFKPSQIRYIPVNEAGVVDLDAFEELLEANQIMASNRSDMKQPFMVSVMLANNESGVIQPVTEIAGLVLERGGLMHCDAVQALGRMPFDIGSLGADLVTITAHKIGGPKGVGALIGPAVDRVLNDPLVSGGGQELGRRAGTEDPVSIAGFAAAAEIACEELADREMTRFLRDRLETRLNGAISDLIVFAEDADRLDNTSFLAVPGLSAENLVIALDLDGISISSGAACSSGKVKKSHVLEAMGFDTEIAQCAFRVSVGPQNWLDDIDRLVISIEKNMKRSRGTKALG